MSLVRLGDIAEQVRGVAYPKQDISEIPADDHVPILRANNVTEYGLSISDTLHVKSNHVSARQMLRFGDIVITASSGSISVVGRAAQLNVDFSGTFGAFCKVVRPGPRVHNRYLGHFFQTKEYRQKMSSLAAGANINNLKNEHLDDLQIPLPPLDEQRRIAAILDQADALRRKRREALGLLCKMGSAAFLQLFGDPNSGKTPWPVEKLGIVGDLERGISKHRPRNEPALLGGIYPLIQTGDVANSDGYVREYTSTYSEAGLRQSKMWPRGTLCITIAANIGKTAVLGHVDKLFTQSLAAMM